jgi:undecaprenyl-diphosphatase
MDLVLILKALLLGLVEGATEFLPVSSTGHLIIVSDLLDFMSIEKREIFEIVIQLGSILAVVWLYHVRLFKVIRTLKTDVLARRFVLQLFIAFLPLALIGLLFHKQIKAILFHPIPVAIALISGGLIILLIEKLSLKVRTNSLDDMSVGQAIKIGFAQSIALIPGVSRSGATILGGMTFGLSRQVATEFSFFLAIPVMFAATGYDLLKHRDLLTIQDSGLFAVGFVAAFFSAFIAIKTLIRYVAGHDFRIFAWYRILLGILVIIYFY